MIENELAESVSKMMGKPVPTQAHEEIKLRLKKCNAWNERVMEAVRYQCKEFFTAPRLEEILAEYDNMDKWG